MAKVMGIENADKPKDFTSAPVKLQEYCGIADLKMSAYGFKPNESMTLTKRASSMQCGLFATNPCEITYKNCAGVFDKSYR